MTNLIFDNPPPLSRVEAEAAFAAGQSNIVCRVLVEVALHDPDWRWIQEVCVRFANDTDSGVRGVAATCIGHLARLHQRIDVDAVLPVLGRLLQDPDVSGKAEDALDDIAIFLSSDEGRRQAAQLKRRWTQS
jgi:hypothetical protein